MNDYSIYYYLHKTTEDISQLYKNGKDVKDMRITRYDIPEKNPMYQYLRNLINSSKHSSILNVLLNEIDRSKICEYGIKYRPKDEFYFDFQATLFEIGMILSMLLKVYFKEHMTQNEFEDFEKKRKEIIDEAHIIDGAHEISIELKKDNSSLEFDYAILKEDMENALQPLIDLAKNTIIE